MQLYNRYYNYDSRIKNSVLVDVFKFFGLYFELRFFITDTCKYLGLYHVTLNGTYYIEINVYYLNMYNNFDVTEDIQKDLKRYLKSDSNKRYIKKYLTISL